VFSSPELHKAQVELTVNTLEVKVSAVGIF
jgi:hypothetical protein